MRPTLWPAHFPVYASSMPFRHPSAPSGLPVLILVTRTSPATFNDLADINATLGNDYWLGFIISGLSPNKKRLALLGAQQFYYITPTLISDISSSVTCIYCNCRFTEARRVTLDSTNHESQVKPVVFHSTTLDYHEPRRSRDSRIGLLEATTRRT